MTEFLALIPTISSEVVGAIGEFMTLFLEFPLNLFLGLTVIGFGVNKLMKLKKNRG